MSAKDMQKRCFDEGQCKCIDEIGQETQASSASQFKEQGLERTALRISFLQKIKGESGMMIISSMDFFFPDQK